MRVLYLRATGTEQDLDDSEEGLTSDSPVVPPISLDEADIHLHLLEIIAVTELSTNGATL